MHKGSNYKQERKDYDTFLYSDCRPVAELPSTYPVLNKKLRKNVVFDTWEAKLRRFQKNPEYFGYGPSIPDSVHGV